MTTTVDSPMEGLGLNGCQPEPLSSYLKALGVFRLVAEQLDPQVRACWKRNRPFLETGVTQSQLIDFFMQRYKPTPIISPWNGGSGFYSGDSTKGLDAIRETEDPRFREYGKAIRDVFLWPELGSGSQTVDDVLRDLTTSAQTKKEGSKECRTLDGLFCGIVSTGLKIGELLGVRKAGQAFCQSEIGNVRLECLEKAQACPRSKPVSAWWRVIKKARTACNKQQRAFGKNELICSCRSRLPDVCLPWIDAAIAMLNSGEAAYNPLLGSGGNEGRLDLSNNFMQVVAELLIDSSRTKADASLGLLKAALFGETCSGLTDVKIGQFNPGRAGGYNQGMEVETKDFKANPWDFVLMIEGSLMFCATVHKRGATDARGYSAVPFTVAFSPVGLGSDVQDEAGRGETWLPLWERPASYGELRALFGEGRAAVGRRTARDGTDFARAMGTLGVDRGIARFARYAYLKRRGESYIALPAGQIPVRMCPSLFLLDELDPLLARIDGFLRQFKNVPVTLSSPRRRLQQAIFAACDEPYPSALVRVLTMLGDIERAVALRDRSKKPKLDRPLLGLSPRWILDSDDGSSEFRIAAALASISATGKVGPIRANLAPIDPRKPWSWGVGNGQCSWHGNSFAERLGGVLAQRMMDAERLSAQRVPCEAHLLLAAHDVLPFLLGETDDSRIEALLWAFTLVDWRSQKLQAIRQKWRQPLTSGPLPRGWCLLRLLHQPGLVRGEQLRADPRIIPLLRAGRTDEAVATARARLKAAGLNPRTMSGDNWVAPERQLAALLVPVGSARTLEDLVLEMNETDRRTV